MYHRKVASSKIIELSRALEEADAIFCIGVDYQRLCAFAPVRLLTFSVGNLGLSPTALRSRPYLSRMWD